MFGKKNQNLPAGSISTSVGSVVSSAAPPANSANLANPAQPADPNAPIVNPVPPADSNVAGATPVNPVAPINPATPIDPAAPGQTALDPAALNAPQPVKKHNTQLIETIILVVVSLIAATFIGLFIFMFIQWNDANTNVQGKIDAATATAVAEKTAELEAKFEAERQELNTDFTGPEEYGRLSFRIPKTWSVYISKDNSDGGDYEAYFNPGAVYPMSANTINSLRLQIVGKSVDSVAKSYESHVKKGDLTQSSFQLQGSDVGNYYEGKIPSTSLSGAVLIFKLRDKTAIFQTDAPQHIEKFKEIIGTITYSQ